MDVAYRCIASLVLACSGFAALPANAGKGGPVTPPTITPATATMVSRNDNGAYAGINWNFGVRNGATAVVGYRAARVNGRDHVDGGKAEFTWVLSGGPPGPGEFRLKAINGRRDLQGELGFGYSFHESAFLLNVGAQGAYANAGVDYLFDKGWLGSIGVNSLDRVEHPGIVWSCPAGATLDATAHTCTTPGSDDSGLD